MRTLPWVAAAMAMTALVALTGSDRAAAQVRKTLDIYVVDVEGGNATMAPPPPGPATPPPPVHNGPAYWFKVAAQADGTFTVTNTGNGFSKTCAATR